MKLGFEELAVRHFNDESFDIHCIPSIADQNAIVATEVVEDDEVASSGCGLVHEKPVKIIKSHVIVEHNEGD